MLPQILSAIPNGVFLNAAHTLPEILPTVGVLLAMNLPGGKFFRTVFYLPNVLAGVAAIFLWKWILAPNGLFNQALGTIGLQGPAWFTDPNWTKPALVVMGMALFALAVWLYRRHGLVLR